VPATIKLSAAAVSLAIGIGLVVPGPQTGGSAPLVGVMAIAGSGLIVAITLTGRVRLTAEGIASWHNFRLQIIPWDTVVSLTAARVPQVPMWFTVKVETQPSGSSYLTNVAGSRRHMQRIASEFEEFRAGFAAPD
jgi:hypothetical protein